MNWWKMTHIELVKYLMEGFEEECEWMDDKTEVADILQKWQDRLERLISNFIKSWIINDEWGELICRLSFR